jgi:hypothetical protein
MLILMPRLWPEMIVLFSTDFEHFSLQGHIQTLNILSGSVY